MFKANSSPLIHFPPSGACHGIHLSENAVPAPGHTTPPDLILFLFLRRLMAAGLGNL